MNKIKFSHKYKKFPSLYSNLCYIDKTILLEVIKTNSAVLHKEFINYDTEIQGDGKYYQLPKGNVLILILRTTHQIEESLWEWSAIWTTIRRWTPEKEKYYRELRGQQVEIVIEEKKI